MARAGQVTNYFTFVGGKNTESSALNSPPNTALSCVNFDLRREGSVWRRKGLAEETGGSASSSTWSQDSLRDYAFKSFVWDNVAGQGAYSFNVIQAGTDLLFYSNDTAVTSDNYKGKVSLAAYAIDGAKAQRTRLDFSSGRGRLYVVGEHTEPCYVEYNFATGTFTLTSFQIEIRDFEGIDDGTSDTSRPGTLTGDHWYNLVNQGWPDKSVLCTAFFGNVIAYSKPINFFKTWSQEHKYPSRSDVYYAMKDDNSPNPYGVGSFSPDVDGIVYAGNSVAPKGHFILNAFTEDRQEVFGKTLSKTLTIPSNPVYKRPSCTAFFASRAFYSGVFASDRTNKVYYSQIIRDANVAGRCYQENDPTTEDFNKLLDTDGGLITISEAGAIYALEPLGDYLIVFASNGVWAIGGTDGGQFKPTGFSVKKISSSGALGRDCCGKTYNAAFYMSKDGIFAVTIDQGSGYPVSQNISLTTIQSDYLAINEGARANSLFLVDTKEQIAYWFYDGYSSYDNISYPSAWNKAIVFNITLQAFYDYELAVDRDNITTVMPAMPFITSGSSVVSVEEGVVTEFPVNLTANVTLTVGPSGRDYTTLNAAYTAINAGTHGTTSDIYAVIVDDGTYQVIQSYAYTNADARTIIWKSRNGATSTTLTGAGNCTDLRRAGVDVIWEGFTMTTSTGAGWLGHQTASNTSVTYSKCIVNTSVRVLDMGNNSGTTDVYFLNSVVNVTNPQVDNHEVQQMAGQTTNIYLYNSEIDLQGAWSKTAGTLTVSGDVSVGVDVSDNEPLYYVDGNTLNKNIYVTLPVYSNGAAVVVEQDSWFSSTPTMKVPSFMGSGIKYLRFYEFSDTTFQDYGVNFDSYLTTGYENLGDAVRNKDAGYVYSFFNRTETDYNTNESGCTMRMKWDWSNADSSGRWTDQQTVYRLNQRIATVSPTPFSYPYDVVETKTRYRGKGRTAQFMFESVDGKDCQMLGWSVGWTGTTNP